MEKSLIVAVADNYAIGRKNALLWNLPGDMKYFRQQTTGNAVIMGWMTFQSIGRPLPKRHNIVISLFPWSDAPAGVTVAYAEAMEVVDTMHITHVHDAPEDADAFFPVIDPEIWREDSRSDMQVDPATGITYEFVVYRRR